MRQKRTVQSSIFDVYADHDIGRELKAMSDWLDAHCEILEWVTEDLCRPKSQNTGRIGLSAESILRCAILKQYRQLSYEELAFFLEDSLSLQAFARLPLSIRPKKSALQLGISAIRDESWERINRLILKVARQEKIEGGRMVRVDSTVTQAPILAPSDSSLLWDAVRIQVRLLEQAQTLAGGVRLDWHDHRRVAKKRAYLIQYARGKEKKQRLYQDLIKVTRDTLGYLCRVQFKLVFLTQDAALKAWLAQVKHYQGLIERVIDQTHRRVLNGEQVPVAEKVVSLFEEHTDIIVKGSRDVQYGHKLNLATGRCGLVLDVVIEDGNPADSERFIPLLERQIEIYGRAPRQMAADGGYASKDNVQQAKAKGVKDVAFHKKKGLKVEQMAKSDWVYRKLRNFRAGVEAGISYLKRSYGLGRCSWKGLDHFKAYIWSSVVAHNLAVFSRLQAA
ncbi:MAG: ISNCY family transposase [Halopseudomonas sp.]